MAPHSSTLAWKIPWAEEPGRLQSMGSLRVRHDWATSLSLFTFMHWRRKWQPTPVFLPWESQGRGSLVGSHRVGHDWSDLAAAAARVSKVMLKILRDRFQQYLNCELPDVQAGFRKVRGTRVSRCGEQPQNIRVEQTPSGDPGVPWSLGSSPIGYTVDVETLESCCKQKSAAEA